MEVDDFICRARELLCNEELTDTEECPSTGTVEHAPTKAVELPPTETEVDSVDDFGRELERIMELYPMPPRRTKFDQLSEFDKEHWLLFGRGVIW